MDGLNRNQMIKSEAVIDIDNFKFEDYFNKVTESYEEFVEAADNMLSSEYYSGFLDVVQVHTETSDIHKTALFEFKANGATVLMNASLNATESAFVPELFYRHSAAMTAVYCIAYLLVFAVGLVGNFFVIAVVFRSPRMRTVTNFFIVNLAVADILVIVFCLPATLMSNIFVLPLIRVILKFCMLVEGVEARVLDNDVVRRLLPILFLFYTDVSLLSSVTVADFFPPYLLIVLRLAPESASKVAEDRRKQ